MIDRIFEYGCIPNGQEGLLRVLQQAGFSCVEYVEQLTMLLFLKMADQLAEPPYNQKSGIPREPGWESLLHPEGAAIEKHYSESIEEPTRKPGILGVTFKRARCDIHNPALLKQLNCLQHVFSLLKINGRAAVVLPGNVLIGWADGIAGVSA